MRVTVFLRAQRRLRDPPLRVDLFGDRVFSAVETIAVWPGHLRGDPREDRNALRR